MLPSGRRKKVPDEFTIVAVGTRGTAVVEADCVIVLEPIGISVPESVAIPLIEPPVLEDTGIQLVLVATLTMAVVQTSVVRPEHAPVER